MNTYGKIALFVGGTLFGSAGIKLLTSKDVKKTYTHTTADVLRCREQVMRDVETVQENCADILADLLDEFIRRLPGVASVTVHERTCGVIIRYTGSRESLVRPLAAFSYDKAAGEISLLSHSSRAPQPRIQGKDSLSCPPSGDEKTLSSRPHPPCSPGCACHPLRLAWAWLSGPPSSR